MSERSPSLDLPFIQPAQAQKHVTHNEAVELLDMIVQLVVVDFAAETPPVAPVEGEVWALGAAPTGAWSGGDGQLATYRGGGWLFVSPKEGWRAWGTTGAEMRVYSGGDWLALDSEFNNLAGLGVNAAYDGTNRLAVAADATLLTHDGSGHQIKVNKADTAQTASMLFQSDWSGRTEMGLGGTDDFSIKSSADGTTWFTGLSVKGVDGSVSIDSLLNLQPGTAPAGPLTGDIYFDAAAAKLRCFDGTVWQDLF